MQFTLLPEGASADKLVCSDPTIPHDDSNLVIKVGKALVWVGACEEGAGRAGGLHRKAAGEAATATSWCLILTAVVAVLASHNTKCVLSLTSVMLWCSLVVAVCTTHAQALNLFRRKTGRSDFFEVKLDKHVPHGERRREWGVGEWCGVCHKQ